MKEDFSQFDLEMTRRALDLAAYGAGQVSPSPLVGCVIVAENGEIVGEGCYKYDGLAHAEVIALGQAGERARGATAYVSLEPHNHHGRTPPCTEALIKAGVRRVVSPIEDPNPLVAGSGFARLRAAGVEVLTGILKREAERQNEKYVVWHRKKRPFVHLKMAVSLDGRIATRTGDARWITGVESRKKTHELRREYDAILIGANTAAVDNPSLTDRSGLPRRRPLVRVVLDNKLSLSPESNLISTAKDAPTVVFTESGNEAKAARLRDAGAEVVHLPEGGRNLRTVLEELGKRELQSVLVEGGTRVAGAFCDAGLIDKATFFIAPLIIGGAEAPAAIGGQGADFLADALRLEHLETARRGADVEITGYPAQSSEKNQ